MISDRIKMGVLAAMGGIIALPASADFDAEAFPPFERCALCHGLFGESANAKFPHLGGQKAGYISAQINAFLNGKRHNDGGQMVNIVSELKPDEIPEVVEWFSSQDAPKPSGDGSATGAALYEQAGCDSCHGATATFPDAPHLTAQHAGYLTKQMRDFRDGRRVSVMADIPHGRLMPEAADAIADIAAYLSSVARQ